jgi:hypothetical protein
MNLRLAVPRVMYEKVLDLVVAEMDAKVEAPRRRMAFGRRNMIFDVWW